MQTYFDIELNNKIILIGKLIQGSHRASKISLESFGSGYISVCTKLGSTFVDAKCRANGVPSWTLSEIDNNVRERLLRNRRQKAFYVTKDGVNFCFLRAQ